MKHPNTSRCRRHAQSAARWYCNDCRLALCTSCRPYAEQLPFDVPCPLCSRPMNEVRPDGEDAGAIRQPLRNAVSLPGLATTAFMALLASAGFSSLIGLILALPLSIALLALMIALVQRAGEDRPGSLSVVRLADIEQIEYCLRMLPLGLPFAAVVLLAASSGSTALLIAAGLIVAVALPVSLMAAVSTDSPRAAIDPRVLWQVVRVTHKQYLPVAVGGALVVVACASILQFGTASSPPLTAAMTAAAVLFALAASSRLGMTIRLHRRRLDYPAGVAPIDRPRPPEPSVYQPAMLAASAAVLLHEKRNHDARLLLGQALTRFPDDPRLNEQFDQLVSATAPPREFCSHLERRMQRLFSSGSAAAATAMWQRYSPQLDNWLPRVSETRYRLALELDEMGDHQTAFRLLIGLSPDDSRFRHTAEAWMEAARILEQKLDDPARAAELRKVVHERYPGKARAWDQRWQQSAPPTAVPQAAGAVQAARG